MSIRMLPALCAGLMLAACSDGNSSRASNPLSAAGTGLLTPGPMDIGSHGNVSNQVFFETDSALLQAEAQQTLHKQAAWLKDYPQHSVVVGGHADERGTREYNLALGERRAQALMDYLIALGIDPKRLKTISYGKERPECTEADEGCWSRNRRAVSTLDS
jgi:peptidoglycan-associated lipoprotein